MTTSQLNEKIVDGMNLAPPDMSKLEGIGLVDHDFVGNFVIKSAYVLPLTEILFPATDRL